jgi:hypothetical protein
MNRSMILTLASGFLALALAHQANEPTQPQPPRAPAGIYAEVIMDEYEHDQVEKNPSITTADLELYFVSLYERLLSNKAVSGITLGVTWARLQPDAPAERATPANQILLNLITVFAEVFRLYR